MFKFKLSIQINRDFDTNLDLIKNSGFEIEYQNKSKNIPEDVLGYNANWR